MLSEVDKRLDAWADFLEPSSKRNFMYIIGLMDEPPRPWPYPDNIKDRIDWAAGAYERHMERMQWLDDDFVPAIMPYTGTEIIAQAFGSPVHYPGDNMPFALPAIRDVSGLRGLKKPDVFSSNLGELFEIAERIRSRVGHNGIVQLPDIQSPLDSAALIWEKGDFLMSMIETPEAVHELVSMVEEVLTEFLDEWFKQFGTDYIAHFPHYPMKGGYTFSEDEVGEFSPEMFEEFSLPSINRLSKRYGGCAMHCCAHARHQWESFRRIDGLKLINFCQPGAVLEESARFFGSDVCHYPLYSLDVQEQPLPIQNWMGAFNKDVHMVLYVGANDREEALNYAEQLKEYAMQRESLVRS